MLNTYTEISLKISMLLTENNAFILRSRAKVQMKAAMDKLFSLRIDCPCDLIVRGGGKQNKTAQTTEFLFWIATVDNSANSSQHIYYFRNDKANVLFQVLGSFKNRFADVEHLYHSEFSSDIVTSFNTCYIQLPPC